MELGIDWEETGWTGGTDIPFDVVPARSGPARVPQPFDYEVRFADEPVQAANVLLSDPQCGLAVVDAGGILEFGRRIEEAGGSLRLLATVEGHNYVKGDDLSLGLYTLERSSLRLERD